MESPYRSGAQNSAAQNSGVCSAQPEGLHAQGKKDSLLDHGEANPLLRDPAQRGTQTKPASHKIERVQTCVLKFIHGSNPPVDQN
jgi:hypothetical protein